MPPPKQFIVGREAEIERFDRLVAGKENHWLLNIYGPGGIGKTVVNNRLVEHAVKSEVLATSVDGIRPDLTPDRILYFFQEGLTQGKQGERIEGVFDDFVGQFEDYLTINEVLRQGGGVPEMFDVVGNVKDPAGLTKTLAELGKTVSENVRTTVNNRFALERYLRGVERSLTSAFAEGITTAQDKAQRPIVLLLDTYEELEALDDWFCRTLMPALPEGINVIILGRNDLHRVNFDWEEFGTDLHAMPLPELSEADAKAYLYHYGLRDQEAQNQVYTFTGGYPLLLVLVRHLAQEHGGWDALQGLERSADRDHIATELLNRILREERTEEVRAFLEKGVVARWFTPEIVGLILEISPEESRTIYDKLRRHSFVEPHPYGLKFHDKIRELLLERLKFNKPEYNQIVKRLMAYYAEKAGIDPDEPTTPPVGPKYDIHIEHAHGLAIGDQAHVTLVDNIPPPVDPEEHPDTSE